MLSLVVDGDPAARGQLRAVLEPFGPCDEAASADAALVSFQAAIDAHRPYDLWCVDIGLPDRSGHALIAEMRQREADCDLAPAHALVVTALADPVHVLASNREGCDGYLVKPVAPGRLRAELRGLGLI